MRSTARARRVFEGEETGPGARTARSSASDRWGVLRPLTGMHAKGAWPALPGHHADVRKFAKRQLHRPLQPRNRLVEQAAATQPEGPHRWSRPRVAESPHGYEDVTRTVRRGGTRDGSIFLGGCQSRPRPSSTTTGTSSGACDRTPVIVTEVNTRPTVIAHCPDHLPERVTFPVARSRSGRTRAAERLARLRRQAGIRPQASLKIRRPRPPSHGEDSRGRYCSQNVLMGARTYSTSARSTT